MGGPMKSKNYVIDLRDWQLEENPHDVPPTVQLDLRGKEPERPLVAAGPTLNLRPEGEAEDQFYEAVPGAARQPSPSFIGLRDVRPVKAKKMGLSWKTMSLLLIPIGLAALVTTHVARSSDLQPLQPLTNNPAAQPQPSELGEQQPVSEEGGKGAENQPAPATPAPQQTSTSKPAQTNTGSTGGDGSGGTGGGSLDPAVDACVTIPGSTICQMGSVDPLAPDPIKVGGTSL